MKPLLLPRRRFLKTVSTLALPTLVPASVLGLNGASPPNSRINLAGIGIGNRARHILPHFMQFKDLQFRAVSDCRADRLTSAKKLVDDFYGNTDCQTHADFRELLSRADIDAVFIATGNRWHGLASILAAKAGKDVYSEKPITLTVEEGRALVDVTQRLGTIYQAGHQRRSVESYRFMVDVVRQGLIGRVKTVMNQVWEGPAIPPDTTRPVPAGFDYDMWLGQSPYRPFTWAHVNNWQYFWDTAEGVLADMGCHYTDIMQFGLDMDHTGPVEYEGWAEFPEKAYSETPIRAEIRCRYANGVVGILQQRGQFAERFIRFVGESGWIQVDDETDRITAGPASILKVRNVLSKSWADTGGHIRNFLDGIKTRTPTICRPEVAHRAMSVCQIANLCLRTGRTLRWDPVKEVFLNDPEANRMLGRALRAPWHI